MSPTRSASVTRVLADIAHAMESVEGESERLGRVLELLHKIVPYDECALLVNEPDAQVITPPGSPYSQDPELRSRLLHALHLLVEVSEGAMAPRRGPHLTVPVIGLDRIVGVLHIAQSRAGAAYDEHALQLLSIVAANLGAYLTILALHREMEQLLESRNRADEVRERVIGIVGHDLRGPLSAIRMCAEAIVKHQELSQTDLRLIGGITNVVNRMDRLIRDLLDFSRTRMGGVIVIHRTDANLYEVSTAVIEQYQLIHPTRTFRCSAAGDVSGRWDRDRLYQVVANLVENAINYGSETTPVEVGLHGEKSTVTVEVLNHGPAIAAELLPHLFDPFRRVQGDAPARFGLGLYICKQIVAAHGGTIEARSDAERGETIFRVQLPRGS